MDVIQLGRRNGKTTTLLKYAAENNCVVVCYNRTSQQETIRIAKQLKLKIPDIVTIDDLSDHTKTYGKKPDPKYVLDDADKILRKTLGVEIYAITLDLER